MLTGSVVVEKIFNVPGIGPYFVDAAFNRDYFLVMGIVLLYAFFLLSEPCRRYFIWISRSTD